MYVVEEWPTGDELAAERGVMKSRNGEVTANWPSGNFSCKLTANETLINPYLEVDFFFTWVAFGVDQVSISEIAPGMTTVFGLRYMERRFLYWKGVLFYVTRRGG